ncbi:MAG TPA: glycosyltransferase [Candidatus Udaeobacter sp.]|nr:glycosyltransferase [Candidatus Udaeobacter sp.]
MISLITTVLNEKNNLSDWLDSILSQTVLPEEIVIVDGGSKDGTWEALLEKSKQNSLLKVWQHLGNISAGRNFAIGKAVGEIIVVTDAGCTYDINWFRKITDPILSGKSIFTATGFGPWFKSDDSFLPYLVAAATTPAPAEFEKDWLPSSRSVAFKKEVWQKAGGYPEWIPLCEDVIFDLKIFKLGIKTEYIREPLVFWQPRKTLQKYFKQLFGYTRSDGHGKLWFKRQTIRYTFYLLNIILLFLSCSISLWFGVILLGLWLDYLVKFWRRWHVFSKNISFLKIITGYIFLPLIILYGDLAKMCGWPVGVYERKTGKIKFEI